MAPAPPIDLEKSSSRGQSSRAAKSRRRSQACTCLGLLALLVLTGGSGLRWQAGTASSAALAPPRADVVFVIDATGSMGDEIEDVKEGLMSIGNLLSNKKPQPDIRFGVVFYRDISDKDLVQSVQLSHDLASVRGRIMGVQADGGGDWKEHVGVGLHRALEMNWSHSEDGGARLIYLVGDAPPQEYDDGYDVPAAVELAKSMGVKVHVIGCSGLGEGRPAMERIATATGGSFSLFERLAGGQGGPPERVAAAAPGRGEREEARGAGGGVDLLLLDVTPLTIGLETPGGVVAPLIRRNAVIPTRAAVTLSTSADGQDLIPVRLFEGERLLAKDNRLLGELNITGVPSAARGRPEVALTLEIDSNGIVRLAREDDPAGEALWTRPSEHEPTEEQIEAMIRDAEASADDDARERLRLGAMTAEELRGSSNRSSPVLLRAAGAAATEAAAAGADAEDEAGAPDMGRLSRKLYGSLYDEL